MTRRWTALVLLVLATAAPAARAATTSPLLPASFTLLQREPGGGTVWQGRIDTAGLPRAWYPTLVYLPPGAAPGVRYPVAYVLHGLGGSPYSLVNGLGLPRTADALIAAH